ncbi:MAG: beta-ketoacyl synthase chain length factor [Casimicrobiaceae bacterium]
MIRAVVTGAGVLAPGLDGWTQTAAVLRAVLPWNAGATGKPSVDLLPPNERRRASETTRYAMHVAQQALDGARLPYAAVKTVLASVTGASEISHQICEALARAERDVSPTKFHNSVHNAPMGYWAIATQCRAPSTALACFQGSFAAGLLETAVQVAAEGDPVLFISCDPPYCAPLHRQYPVMATCAIALVLAPVGTAAGLAELKLELASDLAGGAASATPSASVPIVDGSPTGRGLALLHALASPERREVTLPYLRHTLLRVETTPC